MGEETSFQKHFRTSQSCKAVNSSSLRPEEARVDPEAFQSLQSDISRIFYVSKQTSASCKNAKRSGHLVKWGSLI